MIKIIKKLFGHPVAKVESRKQVNTWPSTPKEVDQYVKWLCGNKSMIDIVREEMGLDKKQNKKVQPVKTTASKPVKESLPKWFCMPKSTLNPPSPAEIRISEQLHKYKVEWYTEVSFEDFITDKGGYFRFDFYLPELKTLIEYDGESYHKSEDVKKRDKLKTEFAQKYGLTLIRYNKKHYYNLDAHIGGLMSKHKIIKIRK